MFEVRLIAGSYTRDVKVCKVGQLLPTIAELMQKHEGDGWKYGANYAIQWRRVSES